MPNSFGFGTDTTGFSSTTHDAIQKQVVDTLRAGLVSLPKGAIVPGLAIAQKGSNFTIRVVEYPDYADAAITNPLTEGVAPTPLKGGIDYLDFTVAQFGAWEKVTDIAEIQSPHALDAVAQDKVARLALTAIDSITRTALATVASANDYGQPLSTSILLDSVAVMQARDIDPVPGAGYYCLLHPYALRGLLGEDGLNGYVSVERDANVGNLTRGAVGQYRGVTFLTSTKFAADGAGTFPLYFLGQNSLAAGDVSTLSYHFVSGAYPGNELAQYKSAGVKGIFGAAPVHFAESTDGSGTNASDVERVLRIGVTTGVAN